MTKKTFNENEKTEHGKMIADQIQDEDAYGYTGKISASDIWNILDNLQTHLFDTDDSPERLKMAEMVTRWLREIEEAFPDMDTV